MVKLDGEDDGHVDLAALLKRGLDISLNWWVIMTFWIWHFALPLRITCHWLVSSKELSSLLCIIDQFCITFFPAINTSSIPTPPSQTVHNGSLRLLTAFVCAAKRNHVVKILLKEIRFSWLELENKSKQICGWLV